MRPGVGQVLDWLRLVEAEAGPGVLRRAFYEWEATVTSTPQPPQPPPVDPVKDAIDRLYWTYHNGNPLPVLEPPTCQQVLAFANWVLSTSVQPPLQP